MGLLTDTLFCILVGIICVLAAHFIFGVPFSSGSIKIFFLLGLLGWATIDYIGKRSETGAAVATIFIIVLVIVLIIFFVLPLITHSSSETTEIPVTPSPVVTARFHSVPSQPIPTLVDPYKRTYEWTYAGRSRTYTIEIPKSLYGYYRNQTHDRNYAKYAISDEDRKVLDSIVMDFETNLDSKNEAAYNIVAFVQSLPYVKDQASTGFDDYARYPIETLVDNKGDCEDTAILTAALLKEMRYDVVLIRLPEHVAVGITCSGCSKFPSYEYKGKNYYYIETTGENWEIGQMPPEYYDVTPTILPM
jgi:hypothetical protein